MKSRTRTTAFAAVLAAFTIAIPPLISAQAYDPTGGVVYELPADEPCLKGRGNCAVYPKSTQLPSGRLVMSFEKSTVVAETGGAVGQTLPIYASDDHGTSWQPLSEVPAPAELSDDPKYARYTSNWTSPYLYVLPERVGDQKAGTLLLASIVTGEDHYYREQKQADPSWTPSNDGDRSDMALALYSSDDEGVTWDVVNVIATGGWQGGSAGAIGRNVAAANVHQQVDPLWEPYLMVHDGELVAYYSDENDYLGYDPETGVAILDPENDTAPDSHGQVLVHKTWDGTSAAWSDPVIDVAGRTVDRGNGKTQIGGGRPGMTNVVPTTDGQWLLTFEYWAGGANTRYKLADSPVSFFADGTDGRGVDAFATDEGSRPLAQGGSPVVVALPDGRLVYNASGSGSVWVNDGRSDGTWTEFQTMVGAGYSRTLQPVEGTGRVAILHGTWGGPTAGAIIRHGEVDLGYSDGAYYRLVNRATGQVIGTGGSTNDANLGNGDVPDVVAEDAGAVANEATQYWHVVTKADGAVTLLNKSGGRAAAIWTGNATPGQKIGQWVDHRDGGSWNLVKVRGYYRLQATDAPDLYLTAPAEGGQLTVQPLSGDGLQDWRLVRARR
jgi:hypothetical protein